MTAQKSIPTLFLSSCVHGGGAGHSLCSILANLDTRIEAHVVLPEPGVIAARIPENAHIHYIPEFVERVSRSPYTWPDRIKCPWLHIIINLFIAPYGALRILRLARKLNIRVIHCNHMLAKPFGVLVGTILKIPVVFHVRNTHPMTIDRKLYDWLGARKAVKRIICNSRKSAETYQRRNFEKIIVIPNGIDLELYKPNVVSPRLRQEYKLPSDCFVVGYVGRLLPKKGLDWLIRAFARFAQKKDNVSLAIIGDNDGGQHIDMKKRYQKLSEQLSVGNQVIFTGFKDDVRPYVADFDVLVFPSIQPESFGRVLLEAMSLKVPAISSELGGAVEVIEHNKQGLLVPVSDIDQLCEAFNNFYRHPDLRKSMGINGRERVESLYGNGAMAQGVFDVITESAGLE